MGSVPCLLKDLPKNLIWPWPNAPLPVSSLRTASSIRWNTNSMFWRSSSAKCTALPIATTYWTHLSVFITGSRYSGTKLLSAESDLFKAWAKPRHAKVRAPKLIDSSWVDCSSAFCRHWQAWEQPSLEKYLFTPYSELHQQSLWLGGCARCDRAWWGGWFVSGPLKLGSHYVYSGQKWAMSTC